MMKRFQWWIWMSAMFMVLLVAACAGQPAQATLPPPTRATAPTNTVLPPIAPKPTEDSATASPVAVSHGGPVEDYVSLIDNLRAAGATIEPVGEIEQPFLAVVGQQITVNGSDVQVFEYADVTAAETDAATITPEGNATTAMITWVAPPHWYKTGKLVVLYVGTDQAVAQLLESVLGPQFAGR